MFNRSKRNRNPIFSIAQRERQRRMTRFTDDVKEIALYVAVGVGGIACIIAVAMIAAYAGHVMATGLAS